MPKLLTPRGDFFGAQSLPLGRTRIAHGGPRGHSQDTYTIDKGGQGRYIYSSPQPRERLPIFFCYPTSEDNLTGYSNTPGVGFFFPPVDLAWRIKAYPARRLEGGTADWTGAEEILTWHGPHDRYSDSKYASFMNSGEQSRLGIANLPGSPVYPSGGVAL